MGWDPVDAPQSTTAAQFIPRGSPAAFDSHIIFAAAHPVPVPGEGIRVYFMGGNGPHNGPRNSSLGKRLWGPISHRFDCIELDVRVHTWTRGAKSSCQSSKSADIVLI